MMSLLSSPPETLQLLVGQTKIDFRAAQAFIADLYANAGLELPEQFDPVEEIVKVVLALREQGKITEESQ
jgi:hypothetical protein